jgi:hypothetical protein
MSVVIKKSMGRFGNQLFPYFTGRIISENLKFKLYGPTESDREFMLHGLDLNYNKKEYAQYEEPVQLLGDHSNSDHFYHSDINHFNKLCHPDFNILDIINDITPRKIILDGYFQRKGFFLPFKENIIEWFNPTTYSVNDTDTAIHIRLGDLLSPNLRKHLLPPDYYEEAIKLCPTGKLTICTDSPENIFIQYLVKKYNATVFRDTEKNTISFLAAHNNLILSQGSFSFWAGFMCNGSNIINALPKTGWNSSVDDVDVDVLLTGEKYKYIKL